MEPGTPRPRRRQAQPPQRPRRAVRCGALHTAPGPDRGCGLGDSTSDSCNNALVEASHSLPQSELVRNHGPWRDIDELELAVAEYVDWFNHRRPHGEIDLVPPAEFEADS